MHTTPLPDILILLSVAVLAVTLFRSLHLSPVLGFLVAGAAIGPSTLGLVQDVDFTSQIAELGVIFLLFLIGLELSWDRLKSMRRQVFGIGGSQVLVTGALFTAIALLLDMPTEVALLIGGGLALSSTALVLQVIDENNQTATQTGRLALAILILQDIAVLPLLVLVPLLAESEQMGPESVMLIILQAVAALTLMVLIGRVALRPLFSAIAQFKSHELFIATSLLTVLGISWSAQMVGMSPALGAFVAGLLLAETEFRHQIEADVKPFKGLLMGLFFMTVGMHIDVVFLLQNWLVIILGAIAVILMKAALLYSVLRLFYYPRRTAGHAAFLLSQGGEFGFILFGLAAASGVMPTNIAEMLLVVIVITMALTPLLDRLGTRFEQRWLKHQRTEINELYKESRDMENHVVIAGYGDVGTALARVLEKESVPFIALDTDPRMVQQGRSNKHPVYYGDATRPDLLAALGASRAQLIVLTMRDEVVATRAVRLLRADFPKKLMLARTMSLQAANALERAGANQALPEVHLTSMRMVSMVLNHLDWPESEITRVMASMRGEESDWHVPSITV
jgi:CPA2 family monovalent cation:H+ antiporter-2